VAPASPPSSPAKIEGSVRYLEGLGYRVLVGPHAESVHGYLAGTDAERAGDLNAMIRDPKVKAIFALRGGYGSPRLLPLLDWAALRRQPKIFSGFSDLTALQLAIFRKCRLVTFSGPMPAVEFWKDPDPGTEEQFWRLLTSAKKPGTLALPSSPAAEAWRVGKAEGTLLGGNLSLIASLLGTPFLPSLQGAILALEEVEESPYRVDRLLTHLRNAGLSRKISGLALGQFTRCEPKDSSAPHRTTPQVLRDFAESVPGPILANLPYGHIPKKITLPLGARVRLNGRKAVLEVVESVVQ